MYEANNKLFENYSFRRFESGGIRKTANFVPCVLATKLTVKMAKTLDISRVFVLCAFSGDNSVLTPRIYNHGKSPFSYVYSLCLFLTAFIITESGQKVKTFLHLKAKISIFFLIQFFRYRYTAFDIYNQL